MRRSRSDKNAAEVTNLQGHFRFGCKGQKNTIFSHILCPMPMMWRFNRFHQSMIMAVQNYICGKYSWTFDTVSGFLWPWSVRKWPQRWPWPTRTHPLCKQLSIFVYTLVHGYVYYPLKYSYSTMHTSLIVSITFIMIQHRQ